MHNFLVRRAYGSSYTLILSGRLEHWYNSVCSCGESSFIALYIKRSKQVECFYDQEQLHDFSLTRLFLLTYLLTTNLNPTLSQRNRKEKSHANVTLHFTADGDSFLHIAKLCMDCLKRLRFTRGQSLKTYNKCRKNKCRKVVRSTCRIRKLYEGASQVGHCPVL